MNDCNHQWQRTESDKAMIDTCQLCSAVVEMDKPAAPQPTPVPANQNQARTVAPVDNSPYGVMERSLKGQSVTERVRLALGRPNNDEAAKNEAFKYISSVLMEVQKSMADDKKDLTKCSPDSVIQSMIDAASYRLPIDGRGLAYLIKYGSRAQFQPGYKGLLYKISEQYRDVDFTAEPVFEGDEISLSDNGGFQTYTHKRVNPFQSDVSKLSGIIACLSYTTESGRHSKVVALPKDEIDKIRSKAKQDFIWKEWFLEKAKAAALKRLCKIHFTTALGLQTLIQYDNEESFELSAAAQATDITPVKPTEKLNALLEKGNAA